MKIRRGITLYGIVAFLATFAILFGGSFVVSPQVVRANNGGGFFDVPSCAFTPQQGRTIVSFQKTKLTYENLTNGPVWIPVIAGTYKVSLMSWDGYVGRSADTIQKDEQWYVMFRDEHGIDLVNSSVTHDLADGIDSTVSVNVVDVSLTIPRDAAKVIAKHAKLYGAYSADPLYAICAAFDLLPTPTQCADGLDNDSDGKIDSVDAACHTDGNPNNTGSYDASRNSENSIPVITRLGGTPITMFEGDTYTDAGATAFDEEDGSITSLVVRGGATVTAVTTKGNYTITYNVTDSKGAAAVEVKRLVIVQEKLGPGCPSCGGGGTVDDPLYISNEKITVFPSGTAAVITWDTTVSATSRVAFGTTSLKTLTLDDNFGYATSTPLFASTTKLHSITIENLLPNTVYYFRPTSKREANVIERAVGIELSTLTPTPAPTAPPVVPPPVSGPTPTPTPVVVPIAKPSVCSEYLRSFIKFGANNDRVEVLKLQSFLRTFEGFKDVPLSGTYDAVTRDAVNVFQDRYKNSILFTWGLQKHTGYVYITTKKHINTVYCGYKQDFPLTPMQKAEIEAYKAQIEKMRAEGIDVSRAGLDNVPEAAGTAPKPSKSAWDVDGQIIKDEPVSSKEGEKETIDEDEATGAVIEAFEDMIGKGDSATESANEANAGKIAKIAAAVSAKIHPSRLIQLLLIIVLFVVGFLLYRSGSRQDDDDDDIPQFGKPTPAPLADTPVIPAAMKHEPEKREPQKTTPPPPQGRERPPQENFAQKPPTTTPVHTKPAPEQPRITLDQLKDNLVLKREENSAGKNPAAEENVIRL